MERVMPQHHHAVNMSNHFAPVYYSLFTLYFITSLLTYTSFVDVRWAYVNQIFSLARIVCVFFLATDVIFNQTHTQVEYIVGILLASIVTIATIVSGSWGMFVLLLFVLAGRNVDIEIIAKCVLISGSIIVVLAIACSKLGIIHTTHSMSRIGTVRMAYGFTHPNSLGMTIFAICCAYAILRFRKFTLFDPLVYAIAYVFCDHVVYSRTASTAILVLALLSIVANIDKKGKLNRIILSFGIIAFSGLAIFSIWLMVNYKEQIEWMANLNNYLSGRIELMNYYYDKYGVHPFGFNYHNLQESYKEVYKQFICDNAFAHVLLKYGYFLFIIFCIAYVSFLIKGVVNGTFSGAGLCLIAFSIAAFSESGAFELTFNCSLLVLMDLLPQPSYERFPNPLTSADALFLQRSNNEVIKDRTYTGDNVQLVHGLYWQQNK